MCDFDTLWGGKSGSDQSTDEYLLSLFENMKLFLHMASFGDFKCRLALVLGFAKQCQAEGNTGEALFGDNPALRGRLGVMLENVHNLYSLMEPAVDHACR